MHAHTHTHTCAHTHVGTHMQWRSAHKYIKGHLLYLEHAELIILQFAFLRVQYFVECIAKLKLQFSLVLSYQSDVFSPIKVDLNIQLI